MQPALHNRSQRHREQEVHSIQRPSRVAYVKSRAVVSSRVSPEKRIDKNLGVLFISNNAKLVYAMFSFDVERHADIKLAISTLVLLSATKFELFYLYRMTILEFCQYCTKYTVNKTS
jgi:hypothetical protein